MLRWLRNIYTPAVVWQILVTIAGMAVATSAWGWGAAWLVLGVSMVGSWGLTDNGKRAKKHGR